MRSVHPAGSGADADRLQASAVRAGDVLLMRSAGDFSTLVAWLGESAYSHAALAVGDGRLVEAITGGVSETVLGELIDDGGIERIDAYRPSAYDGSPFSVADEAAIAARARHYLGKPFATSRLFMLGVFAAMRDKSEIRSRLLRRLLNRVFDRIFAGGEGNELICSELVYRSLRECEVLPGGRLRPVILERIPNPTPMPEIDLFALAVEIGGLLAAGKSLPISNEWLLGAEAEDVEFERSHARARALLGLPAEGSLSGWKAVAGLEPGPREIPDPKPHLVRPREFEVSPSLKLLGRVK